MDLLSVFGGVVLTLLAGTFVAVIQSRNDHARWVRERRYDAYVGMVPALDAMLKIPADLRTYLRVQNGPDGEGKSETTKMPTGISKSDQEAIALFMEEAAVFSLLGPDAVGDALEKFAKDCLDPKASVRNNARKQVLAEMRNALKVKVSPRSKKFPKL